MSRNIPTSNLDSELPLFARRLKQARLAAGLSQERLGVAAGVDEFSASARLNQYERGKHTPDVLTATHLARVLKVPLAYFWASDDDEAQLLCAFHALTGKEREQVLALAVALMLPPAKPHH
jgi:transcriptional regulator with XRE-family HTH domain